MLNCWNNLLIFQQGHVTFNARHVRHDQTFVAIAPGSSVPGIARKVLMFDHRDATCLCGSYQSGFLRYLLLSAARQIVAVVFGAMWRVCCHQLSGTFENARLAPVRNGGRFNIAHRHQLLHLTSCFVYLSQHCSKTFEMLSLFHAPQCNSTIKSFNMYSFNLGLLMGAKQPWQTGWLRRCPTVVLCTKTTFSRWVWEREQDSGFCFSVYCLSSLCALSSRQPLPLFQPFIGQDVVYGLCKIVSLHVFLLTYCSESFSLPQWQGCQGTCKWLL